MNSSMFSSFPRGWFRIALSSDIKKGQTKTVHYFGQDIVIFRGESGKVSVFDPHCPHMGAHLGVGGKVVGDTLRCPFHGWCFNHNGEAVHVPHAKRIPQKAKARTWTVNETGGVIFVYYHWDVSVPAEPFPDLSILQDTTWSCRSSFTMKLNANLYEQAENAVDRAHFDVVHHKTLMFKAESEDEKVELKANGDIVDIYANYYTKYGPLALKTTAHLHLMGIGCGENTFSGQCIPFKLVALGTPVENNVCETEFIILTKRIPIPFIGKLVNSVIMWGAKRELKCDIPIWENKIFREHPILSDFDGPVMKFRKWFSQFYPMSKPQSNIIAISRDKLTDRNKFG